MTAPREPHRPPSPPDRRPSPRGGHPSSQTASAAARSAGLARLAGARRGLVHSVRTLAAAALLALSGGLALPATAEAQTCTLNTGDLWCGVVTVGEIASGDYGFVSISGGNVGDLTDNSGDRIFTSGTAQYAVYRVAVSSFGLSFAVTRTTADGVQSPGLLDDDRARLHLHVDGHSASFAFSDVALSGTLGYEWSGASLDWSSTGSVTVRLREVAALSSDATLSGLTVTGGGSELVTFVSGTTTYAASVVSTVAEVTVTPTTTDTGATIEYLDGDDATLTDAGTADGHQVALAVGDDTVIKVKVTAEDGNATQTYMVTVTRAADTDTTAPTLISAIVGRSGGTTTLRFSEDLPLTVGEALSATARGAFSRTVNGVAQNIADIRRDFLTAYSLVVYHTTIYSGQTAVVSYDQSAAGADAIADAAGNEVVDFTTGSGGVPAVTNSSTQVADPLTLSALVVNDGNVDLTLTPTFVSGTTTYTARVASTVAEVTVTARTTNSGESIEYLDGDDATLDDAGTAAGHQVAVAEGANVIKVKVTAADGNTTQTYTVTVTRAAAQDTTAPTLTSASVARSGSSTTLWFSEDLDLPSGTTLSATAQGAFSLTTDSGQQNIREILRGFGATGARSVIVHHSKIYSGETVVVSYDQSAAGADAIDDAAGNEVVDFTTGSGGVPAVTNSSAQVAAATDATLSALTVTGGGSNLVTFVSGTTTYTARVASTVTEVTLTPTKNNTGATIEYLDGDDATLDDAGTAAGHQVAVAEGANVIKVKVTAADGNTTQTYTVTVTRAAPDTPSPYDPNAGITMIDTNGDPLTGNPIRLTIREGTRGRYGFKLNTRPTHAVWVAGIQSDGDPDVLVLPSAEGAKAILADEWETPFYVKIRAALDDDEKNGERYFLNRVNSRDRNYNGLILPDVIVVEDDRNDDAGALSVADAEATEGVDDTLDFVVKLDRRPSLGLGWEVTVDYRTTQDGRAIAGSDYTSTSGTLTFAPGEDKKTVSVPIMDDAVEDDGETFTLVLSNAINAGFARNGTQAVGTIRNTEPLTATFPESVYASAQHKGPSDRPQVVVAFSAPVAAFGADTPSVSATGASVDGVQRLDKEGLENAYVFFLTPEGQQAIVFRLHANRACPDGGICTADRRHLSNSPSATIPGPSDDAPEPNTAAAGAPTISGTPRVGEALSASTSGISDADGLDDARFGYQWIRTDTDIGGATGGTYTPVDADEGERLKVRVSFTDDAGHEESLTSAATDAVTAAPESGSAAEPLTAAFEGVPAAHDGETAFRVRLAFSEGISISYTRMRDASFTVTGGDVTAARRVDGRRDLWEITIEPDADEAVTVRLPETTDCAANGAICTGDGRGLSQALSATIAGPPERNTAATGMPTISGTAQVGEALTASTSGISDADGLDDARFAYQWIRTDTDIQGATGSTYTVVDADEGKEAQGPGQLHRRRRQRGEPDERGDRCRRGGAGAADGELRGPAGRTPRPGVVQLPRGVQRGDQHQLQDRARRVVPGDRR